MKFKPLAHFAYSWIGNTAIKSGPIHVVCSRPRIRAPWRCYCTLTFPLSLEPASAPVHYLTSLVRPPTLAGLCNGFGEPRAVLNDLAESGGILLEPVIAGVYRR